MGSDSYFWELLLLVLHFTVFAAMLRYRCRTWQITLAYLGYVVYRVTVGAIIMALFHTLPEQILQLIWWFVNTVPFAVLMVALGPKPRSRAFFLFSLYFALTTFYAPLCTAIYLKWPGLATAAVSTVAAVGFNAYFAFRTVPLVMKMDVDLNWKFYSLEAALIALLLFAESVWPHSLVGERPGAFLSFGITFALFLAFLPFSFRNQAVEQVALMTRAAQDRLELLLREMDLRREAIEDARRIRHDRRHHQLVLTELLEKGDSAAALGYLKNELTATELSGRLIRTWCANEVINAILSGYNRRAEQAGVKFTASALVDEKIGISDSDLVTLLANLLENAINAASVACAARPPEVTCSLKITPFFLGMTITNTVGPDVALTDGFPCAELGIGLRSARDVLRRNGGDWLFELQDGVLTCKAKVAS